MIENSRISSPLGLAQDHGRHEPEEIEERLEPAEHDLEAALKIARTYWHDLAAEARVRQTSPLYKTALDGMLCQVPAMPSNLGNTIRVHSGSDRDTLEIECLSTWELDPSSPCILKEKKKTIKSSLLIGCQSPIQCSFEVSPKQGNQEANPTLFTCLVLGWSYILSALLIEQQGGENASLRYTRSLPHIHGAYTSQPDGSHTKQTVKINDLEPLAARWWAAVLAPDRGWEAIIFREANEIYYTPWSCFFGTANCIGFDWNPEPLHEIGEFHAASASAAFQFLIDFALQKELGQQLWKSLAMALLFPTHNYYGIPVALTASARCHYGGGTELVDLTWDKMKQSLLYHLTLSCNPSVIMSSLAGTFWNNDIACNFVSPWLHPILHEIPEFKDFRNDTHFYYELLSKICSIRCPRLSPLWIGAALSGLVPEVIKQVERGTPILDPVACSWLGYPQSFMDSLECGPYFDANGRISRADAWQIRYLPYCIEDDSFYESQPFTPWKPPGYTTQGSCDLRVKAHSTCQRHRLKYCFWTWKCSTGLDVIDEGYTKVDLNEAWSGGPMPLAYSNQTTFPILPLSREQVASQNASRAVLQWATVNGEGIPKEGIYHDGWVKSALYDSDDDALSTISNPTSFHSDDSINQNMQETNIQQWLAHQ